MPFTFENIANSFGKNVKVTMYAPGGAGIVNHVCDPNVYNLFRQSCWDYFVLQPGSNESPGYSYPIDLTLARTDTLLDSLYKYNPCAKVLFYQIPYGVYGTSANDLVSYNNTMDLILANNQYLSDSTKSFFAPVGEAFRASWNNDTTNMLWTGYLSVHPNARGSYIAACVFYTTIFKQASHGTNEFASLSPEIADSCQLLADSIVLNNFSAWRINVYNQSVDFNFVLSEDTVFFTNLSQNYDSIIWDLGDGYFSNDTNPVHVYQQGTYFVKLISFNHSCQNDTTKLLDVITKISSNYYDNCKVYPNPCSDIVNINFNNKNDDSNVIVNIYDVKGNMLLNNRYKINKDNNSISINVSNLLKGIYFMEINTGTTSYIKQIIK